MKEMGKEIKILHLEDEYPIVQITEKLLTSQGYSVTIRQVQTREEFEQELVNNDYDLILADYSLPNFDGLSALQIAHKKKPDTPFILFSGSIGEEKAINSLRMGATDYVLKQNISVLAPTITRALEEAKTRKEKEGAVRTAIENEKKFRLLFEQAPDGILVIDRKTEIRECNPTFTRIIGYQRDELIGKSVYDILSEPTGRRLKEMLSSLKQDGNMEMEGELVHKNNNLIAIWCKGRAIHDSEKESAQTLFYVRDIRQQRHSQMIERIIYNISSAAIKKSSMEEFFAVIKEELSTIIDTRNTFIGLFDPFSGELLLPFMQDEKKKMSSVSLEGTISEVVIKQKQPLLLRGKELEEFKRKHKIKQKGAPAKCWLGVPLIVDNSAFGILVVQDYSNPDTYTQEDVQLLEFIAVQIAASIQRKQMEKRLIQLSRAVEQNPASIVITDPDGNIEYVNDKFTEITGYSYEEAIGQNPRILKSGETPAQVYQILWQTITSGKVWKGRFHNKKKNGELFWEEAIIRPVIDDHGKIINYLAIKEDITKIKETEDAFQNLFKQNQQLLEAITSILIVMDHEEKIIRWNRAAEETFGIQVQDVIGKTLLQSGIKWDWSEITQAVQKCRDERIRVDIPDLQLTDATGNEHFVNLHIVNYGQEDGFSGFLILGEDITQWKTMQSQLIQAQKLESVGQLASGIAHEINTPIQYIGDNVRFLQETFKDTEPLLSFFNEQQNPDKLSARYQELMDYAREIDLSFLLEDVPSAFEQTTEGITRVAEIVRAMKEFTHPQQKEKEIVDINKALHNTILISRNEWKYVADMETRLSDSLPTTLGYLGELNQAFLNIIVNAAHAVKEVVKKGEKGKITVTTYSKGDSIRIEISDTGCGIKKEHLNKIFDPFFTTKEVGKGTGQGLTIAYNAITQKHGGKIWCESERNKGTTFFIELPVSF